MKLTVTDVEDTPRYYRIRHQASTVEQPAWSEQYVSISGFFGSLDPHKMAAAEDLYAALERCRKEVEVFSKVFGMGVMTEGALSSADAALHKARGEAE